MKKVLLLVFAAALMLADCVNVTLGEKSSFLDMFKHVINLIDVTEVTEKFFLDDLPRVLGQRPCNEFGSFEEYKDFLHGYNSNDEIALSGMKEIITRSGYKYEEHISEATDGYLTHLTRVVNPLADRSQLKPYPIVFFHGGASDLNVYLWASAKEHWPEKYPRSYRDDGPITSLNRSVVFMLANNGFDVWLVNTRGSINNQKRKPFNKLNKKKRGYWDYSFDDIIEYELGNQLNAVLKHSKSEKVSIFCFSFSTILLLSFLGQNEQFAKNKVHKLIVQAPLMTNKDMGIAAKLVLHIINAVPPEVGTPITELGLFSKITRKTFVELSKDPKRRYTVMKGINSLIWGSSGQYRTVMELPFWGHIFLPTSYKQIKHFAQITFASNYQKYDYGKKNLQIYGQEHPPSYDISQIHVKDWLLISGLNDNLGTPLSVDMVLDRVNPKPLAHIKLEGYHHLDFLSAVDNDELVMLPILNYLEQLVEVDTYHYNNEL